MWKRIIGTMVVAAAVLGVPRPSEASLLEFIWEMSGPQMIGSSYACSFTFKGEVQDCWLGEFLSGNRRAVPSTSDQGHGPFLYVGALYALSTGRNQPDDGTGEKNYIAAKVHMVGVEPGITYRSWIKASNPKVYVAHSAGLTYDLLFGLPFRRFDKFGFTVTPVQVAYKYVAIGFKVRIYPNGFTPDEFGFGPRLDINRRAERVYGGTVSIRLK